MFTKSYCFAGYNVKLISDTPVYDSDLFSEFRREEASAPQMSISIIHSALPEKSGDPVFSDETSAYYVRDGKGFYYSAYPSGRGMKQLACRVTDGEKITLFVAEGQRLWDSLVAFAVNYTQLLFHRGIATAHSSCIEFNGKAVLFAGNKCVGKSTQAALWNRFRGAKIINGDRIALKPTENGLIAYGIPFCGSSGIAVNRALEVMAIVLPGKAGENSVSRLDAVSAFKAVLGNLTYNTEDMPQMKTALDTAEAAAEKIPVFELMCVPDESAVKILEEQLCQI